MEATLLKKPLNFFGERRFCDNFKLKSFSDDMEREGRLGYLEKQPTIFLMVTDFSNWGRE